MNLLSKQEDEHTVEHTEYKSFHMNRQYKNKMTI